MRPEERRIGNRAQEKIGVVGFYPSVMKDGQILFAVPKNKPARLYIKTGGRKWWANLTKDGKYFVEKRLTVGDFKTSGSAEFGDCIQNGHKDNQEFTVNAFQYPNPGTDWTPSLEGALLPVGKANKKCWLPLNFLKIGDEIVSYKLVGDIYEDIATILDCKLVRINKANPLTTSDITGGAIAQQSGDGNFDVEATLSSVETVATDKQYTLEISGTTTASIDKIYVIGAELKVNRK